jgi:hypothetical protein
MTTLNNPPVNIRQQVIDEAKKLAVDVLYSEKGHFAAAGRWSSIHLWIGIPSTVLAACAGAGFFTGIWSWIPSLLAFAASALSAIATFLNPRSTWNRYHQAGVRYGIIRRQLRQFINVDAALSEEEGKLAHELKKFTEEIAKLQLESPAIPAYAYKSAGLSIVAGSATYTEADVRAAMGHPSNSATETKA